MDVRIGNGLLGSIESTEAKKAEQAAGSPQSPPSSELNRIGSSDQVKMSPISEALNEGDTAYAERQAARVKELGALYQTGQYDVDATDIAKSIVSMAFEGPGDTK